MLGKFYFYVERLKFPKEHTLKKYYERDVFVYEGEGSVYSLWDFYFEIESVEHIGPNADPVDYNFHPDKTSQSTTVTANCIGSVTVTKEDSGYGTSWFWTNKTSLNNIEDIEVSVSENNSGVIRSGKIKLQSAYSTMYININQTNTVEQT
jgi:hypothetical protein